MGGSLDILGLVVEDAGRHLIAAQLVKQVQKLLQKGRFLGGAAVHGQLGGYFPQGLLHGQQPAAGIQRHLGNAAGNGQDPVAEAAEAQNLRVAAGSGAAGTAQVDLRLVGGMLRHQ